MSRSTFGYAAAMFAVLFAPLAGKDPHGPNAHTLSMFPDVLTLVLFVAIVFFCVRQALQNRPAGEGRFLRGLLVASIVSAIAGALDAVAIAGLAPMFFSDRTFVTTVACGSALVVWLLGTLLAVVFSYVLARALPGGVRRPLR